MRIVAFGIHPDDIELGCGGTVALCRRLGHEVVLVDLTRGEAATNGTPEIRSREALEAARILGCAARLNAELPDTGLVSESAEQLRAVTGIIRARRPHVVIYPTADDPHPDHVSGSALIERAMSLSAIRGYATDGEEVPWKGMTGLVYGVRRDTRSDVVVDITSTIEIKRRAIAAHASQFSLGKDSLPTGINAPHFLEMIDARDRANGGRIGTAFGEAFSTTKPIGLKNLDVLAVNEQ